LTEKSKKNFILILTANFIGGIIVVYLIGSLQLSLYTGIPYFKALVANFVFIPGDLIKATIATLIGVKVLKQKTKENGEL